MQASVVLAVMRHQGLCLGRLHLLLSADHLSAVLHHVLHLLFEDLDLRAQLLVLGGHPLVFGLFLHYVLLDPCAVPLELLQILHGKRLRHQGILEPNQLCHQLGSLLVVHLRQGLLSLCLQDHRPLSPIS